MEHSNRIKHKLADTICYIFIFLFANTAFSKLNDLASFAESLVDYPLIGSYADIIAWAIPAMEALVCVLLIVPATRLIGLYASLKLMIVFTAYLLTMLMTNADLPCSCGGVISQLTYPQHLIVNTVLVAVAWFGIVHLSPIKVSSQTVNY